jgi:hypothetical protein
MGFSGYRGALEMSDALTVSEARPGLKMVNAFGHRQSPERMNDGTLTWGKDQPECENLPPRRKLIDE